ncbi:MAG: protein kinase, partial [Thermoanaerobaculia bacterium]|nr:protein kinase [Thermoanaerobaculia bacterium]
MSSMIGTTISHFKVTSKVGEGGMGEVYRATDLRLNREVAVKALPESFVQDEQRLARFEREAQLLASLSHPNIAGIHGLEEQDGKRFLILELVEGEDLSERLRRGSIPLEEALGIALQIAEALEAAHDKGIVHRDLKPANVKLTPQGQVKVLDFGLAKALEVEATSGEELANSPTLTMAATQAGIIRGTAAYMSPEQAAAQPADRRADVWSFGVVLTEMLTGEQLFTGQTASHVLAAVLQKDVDVDSVLPDVPGPIRDLIERCLRKEVRQRLQAIGDARIAIEEYLADPEAHQRTAEPQPAPVATSVPLWQRVVPWAVAALLLAAVVALALRGQPQPAETGRQLLQASLTPPEGLSFDLDPTSPGPATVSPDGSMIALTARAKSGEIELYVRRLDESRARLLQDTEGAAYPFWSPDSRSLGFFTDEGNLKRIEIAGGPPTVLAEAPNGKGGSWGADGTILFAPAHNTPIHRVPAGGGEATAVTEMVDGDVSHRHPRLLPDGESFLYLERTRVEGANTESQLVRASLDGESEEKILLRSPAAAEFASGHILFLHEETLMARPFDVASGEFAGDAAPLASDVTLISVGSAKGLFSASDNGVLVYGTGQNRPGTRVVWFGRSGGIDSSLDEITRFLDVSLSPDDEFAALGIIDPVLGSQDLWIYEIERNLRTRFTFDQGNDSSGVWSPDGSRLAFASDRGNDWSVYVKSLSGVGE